MLKVSKSARTLRSSCNGLILDVPFCKTETASRAFSVYAPKLWNSLPRELTDTLYGAPVVGSNESVEPLSISSFKRSLKYFLFNITFADVA